MVWTVAGVGDLWGVLCAYRDRDGDYQSAKQSLPSLSVDLWHRVSWEACREYGLCNLWLRSLRSPPIPDTVANSMYRSPLPKA